MISAVKTFKSPSYEVDVDHTEYVLRALTLKCPSWALELCLGIKFAENRSWAIPPGWCYISRGANTTEWKRCKDLIRKYGLEAAGKGYLKRVLNTPELIEDYIKAVDMIPPKSIIGMVKFEFHTTLEFAMSSVAAREVHTFDYRSMFTGPLCNFTSKAVFFDEPHLNCPGALGLWKIPERVYEQVKQNRNDWYHEDKVYSTFSNVNMYFFETLFDEAKFVNFPKKVVEGGKKKRKLEVGEPEQGSKAAKVDVSFEPENSDSDYEDVE